jgi:putative membrane protein
MGLANLVPGISGGTMLLASGVYTEFVEAVAAITSLRIRRRPVLVLASVVSAAALAILLLAGPVKELVVHRRWLMYSLFIGLTLGGIPVVWRMARPAGRATWLGAVAGFVAMGLLSLGQMQGAGESGDSANFLWLIMGGLAGAGAMILPGVSGGYLLLVLKLYVPILAGIDQFKEALRAGEFSVAMQPAVGVLLPVGLGVILGVAGVSNLLRWLLRHRRDVTLGVLLGLLLGAVLGLWPFQQSVEAVVGETVVKGQLLSAAMMAALDAGDLPTEFFRPSAAQVGASLALILLGFGLTTLIARLGGEDGG